MAVNADPQSHDRRGRHDVLREPDPLAVGRPHARDDERYEDGPTQGPDGAARSHDEFSAVEASALRAETAGETTITAVPSPAGQPTSTPRARHQPGVASPDGQFVISLARGAIPPASGATNVSVRITPLDAASLAPLQRVPLPPMHGLVRPSGNAYRLELTYEPGGRSVSRLAKPGSLLLEIPEYAEAAYQSPNGNHWSRLATRVIRPADRSMTTTLDAPGYFVVGTDQPSLPARKRHSSRDAWIAGIGVALLAALMADYARNAQTFDRTGLAQYNNVIAQIKRRYAGTPIGASESIVALLAQTVGLKMLTPESFLDAVAEGNEPTARDPQDSRNPDP